MSHNYRYRIEDKDFILTAEEHQKIQGAVKEGKSVIKFPNGQEMNLSYCKYIVLTDLPADSEPQLLKLTQGKMEEDLGEERPFNRQNHDEYYKHMGWEHGENCRCKDVEKKKAEIFNK